ncbi:MAG: hypothetical protein GKS00_17635 [Alphaproteobacteria bacterium]|nr:hypothetical protein [Alphaproteobacteria bacterium]
MLSLQVNAALSIGGGGAVGVPNRSLASDSDNPSTVQRGGEINRDAARPGPPIARLDFQTQNQSQSVPGEAEGDGAAQAQAEEGARTNEDGEKVDENGLTEAEQREIEKLKARDREVRAHEQAHAAAGGSVTGSPQLTFTQGPDGKQYAVSGEVSVDTSPVRGNPEATIRKMELVRKAALAPASPSSQDRRVAAEADAQILAARQEIAKEKREAQAEQAEKRSEGQNGDPSIGQSDPAFDPEKRFNQPVGGASSPLNTGLAGTGELNLNTEVLSPGDLFNLVA